MTASITGPGGSITVAGEVEVKNDTGNPIPVEFPPDTGLAEEATLVQLRDKDFATQVTLGQALAKLNDIFGAVDGLEITAGNIDISNTNIGLDVDEVESLLRQLRDTLATDVNLIAVKAVLDSILTELPEVTGAWSYEADTLTSGSLSATGRVQSLRVFAVTDDGSFKISGGDTIVVRGDTGFDLGPEAQLTDPTIAWVSGNLDCFIAVLA